MELAVQALVQGILMGGVYALVALGFTVVYNITGVVNMSHGDLLSMAMFFYLSLNALAGLDPYVAVVIGIPVMFLVGGLLYRLLIRPIIDKHILMIIQLTLGLMFIIQNGLLMGYGGEYQRVPAMVEHGRIFLGDLLRLRLSLVIAFGVSLVLAGFFYWVLTRTDYGRMVRAIHQNPQAAALMGVNVERVRTITFAIGVAVLAVAAALLVPGQPIAPIQGLHFTVTTLIVFMLGGMGNFAGTFLGALIIGVAESFGNVYLSGTVGFIVPFVIFVLFLLYRPQGLLSGGHSR